MADTSNVIETQLVAKNDMDKGMAEGAASAKKGAEDIGSAFKSASSASDGFQGTINSLSGALKDHRTEEIQTARQIGFFTKELEGFVGKGNEAAKVLGAMAGGFAMGGGVGMAIEGLKVGFELAAKAIAEFDKIQQVTAANSASFAKSIADVTQRLAEQRMETMSVEDKVRFYGMTSTQIAMVLTEEEIGHIKNGEAIAKEVEAREKSLAPMKRRAEGMVEDSKILHDGQIVLTASEKKLVDLVKAETEEIATIKAHTVAGAGNIDTLRMRLAALNDLNEAEKKTKAEVAATKGREAGDTGNEAIQEEFERRTKERNKLIEAEQERKFQIMQEYGRREQTLSATIEGQMAKIHSDNEDRKREASARTAAYQEDQLKKQLQLEQQVAQGIMTAFGDAMASVVTDADNAGKAMLLALVKAARAAVMAYAASAAAGGASSQAGIPVIGPALAVAAAGTLFGFVEALVEKIPSARGGYDIPSGINPLTQLHENEMVLPADIANPLRENLGAGGGDWHVSISAIDGPSVQRMVESPSFIRAIKEARRNGIMP